MAKRKANQGRQYATSEWLEFMLEGEIESQAQAVRDEEHELSYECYDVVSEVDAYDIPIEGDLKKVKEDFERDVEKAINEWAKRHPFEEGVDADDIMDAGAPGDVYLALDGSGAGGIWDDEWQEYFVDGDDWSSEDLVSFMEKKLGKYIDDSGGGKIPNEMGGAVYAAFAEACEGRASNPKVTRKLRNKLLK